ncbi:hypothetical protein ACI79G_15175 [Geodermatophilus sp. SYSU D00779]
MGNPAVYVSAIAVLLTLWVIWRDYRLRVRGQADLLAAWVIRSRTSAEPHRVVVKNASNLPCTDVVVGITAGYRRKGVILSKTFGAMTDGRVKPRYEHAVGPDETITVYETTEDVAVRSLSFVDAAGRRWVRRGAKLSRVRPRRFVGTRRRLRTAGRFVRARLQPHVNPSVPQRPTPQHEGNQPA